LTGAEINLLKLLCQHRGTVLSRDFLTRSLKGHDYMPFDRSIDVMIARLRKKLASSSFSQEFIRTIWGKGYQLVIDHQNESKT
jgi:two-component system phosphate regulon response regulator OmpR